MYHGCPRFLSVSAHRRHEWIPVSRVVEKRLLRVAIDKVTLPHRMVKAANLVLDLKQRIAVAGIDDVLKTILMLVRFLGNQPARFEVCVRC